MLESGKHVYALSTKQQVELTTKMIELTDTHPSWSLTNGRKRDMEQLQNLENLVYGTGA